jgi:hypothetical protein
MLHNSREDSLQRWNCIPVHYVIPKTNNEDIYKSAIKKAGNKFASGFRHADFSKYFLLSSFFVFNRFTDNLGAGCGMKIIQPEPNVGSQELQIFNFPFFNY